MRPRQLLVGFGLCSLWACGSGTSNGKAEASPSATDETKATGEMSAKPKVTSDQYEPQMLEEYRAALPSDATLAAPSPGAAASEAALTRRGNAALAEVAIQSALNVNAPARAMIAILRALTHVEPTLYNSKTQEFVWGPWDNKDGFGQVLAYVRKNKAGEDFQYGYAFVRLIDSDIATAAPVIWGGSNPPASQGGSASGATLWDFVANQNFEQQNNPNYDSTKPLDKGRFAMVYGREDKGAESFAYNVAVFRDFVSKDEPKNDPANLDYFYGHVKKDSKTSFDFVDWRLTANLCEDDPATCFKTPEDGNAEFLNLRAAFINDGPGRAEARIVGGDLSGVVDVVECWDNNLDRTAVTLSTDDSVVAKDGECDGAFAKDLATLGVPSLLDVDPATLLKIQCIAQNGLELCADASKM